MILSFLVKIFSVHEQLLAELKATSQLSEKKNIKKN
jgi:hypothetical protein